MQDSATAGLQNLQGSIGNVGVAAGVAGVAVAAAFAAAAVAVTAAAFEIGKSFDESFDSIRLKTGQTGEALAGLEDDFKAVFSAVPDDAGAVSDVLGELAVRTGLTGEALQDLTKSVLDFSRVTGTQAAQNAQDLTRLFKQWNIASEDQVKTMDKLLRASQASGVDAGRLEAALVKNRVALQGLGLDFDSTLAIMANFERNGVNTEQALVGMGKAFGKLAKDGGDVKAAFSDAIFQIQMVGTESEATALAIELFGVKAGPELAAAIREGSFSTEELLATIADGSETVAGAIGDTEDFAEAWAKFSHTALVAIEPVATAVFNLAGVIFEKLTPALASATSAVAPFAAAFANLIGLFTEGDPEKRIEMFNQLSTVFGPQVAEGIALVSSGIIGIVDAMTGGADGMSRFQNALTGLFGPEVAGQIMEVVAAFQQLTVFIGQMITVTQEALAPIFGTVDGLTVLKLTAIGLGLAIATTVAAITIAFAGLSAGVAALATAWNAAFTIISGAVNGVRTNLDTLAAFFGEVNFFNLVTKWKDDAIRGFDDMIAAIKGKVAEIAALLPHSPAEEGPLSEPVNWGWLFEGMPQAATAAIAETQGALESIGGGTAAPGTTRGRYGSAPLSNVPYLTGGNGPSTFRLGDIHVEVTPDANGNVSVESFTQGVQDVAGQLLDAITRGLANPVAITG